MMTQQEFNKVVELHQKWLRKEKDGEQFRFEGENFIDINFHEADLRHAELVDCSFVGSNMRCVNLSAAYLRECDFEMVDLDGVQFISSQILNCCFDKANMQYVYLTNASVIDTSFDYADLSFSNVRGTNFVYSSLSFAILREVSAPGANFSSTRLHMAKIDNMFHDSATASFLPLCPEEGSFIGFKKCVGEKIVKLLIPEDAKRSNATTRKCRCDKAKVLEITDAVDRTITYNEAISFYDADFHYRVGGEVRVDNFNDDRWAECSSGIHFFITRDEAVKYCDGK